MKRMSWLAVALLSAAGCVIETDNEDGANAPAPAQQPAESGPAARPQPPDVTLEVSLAQRAVNVYRGGQQLGSYPAAVGSTEWPTPTGEWTISQVIFNPRWLPPKDEEWAEDEKTAEPGARGYGIASRMLARYRTQLRRGAWARSPRDTHSTPPAASTLRMASGFLRARWVQTQRQCH